MGTPAHYGDLTRRGYVGDAQVAQVRLEEAWRALQAEMPTVPARLDSGDLANEIVVDVLCSAALRVLRNGEVFTEGAASQDLYFTAAERLRVAPSYGTPMAGSFKYS